ncbi:MAG: TIGR02444 family protein [Rhodospirillaceae bacterium]
MTTAGPGSLVKDNPLWDFMTATYKEPGVEKACLALQKRHGADVNMILFCIWLAYRGAGSEHLAHYLGSALKLSRSWQSTMVEPLRTARNNLKDHIENSGMSGADKDTAAALRERIKACELEMEHMETLALYALVPEGEDKGIGTSPAESKDDARNNLTVYFAAMGVQLDPLGEAHVMRILTSVFGS